MTGQNSLRTNYTSALVDYITTGSEQTLDRAYELGRQALESGLGILDIAEVHHASVAEVMSHQKRLPKPVIKTIEASKRFMLEAQAAFEMAYRGYREANMVLRQFNETLEDEIKKIAHILHDQTGQLIAAIYLEFDLIEGTKDRSIRQRLVSVRELLTKMEEQMRRVTYEIRPPLLDDLGLVAAIEFLKNGLEQRSKLRIRVQGPHDQRYPEPIEIAVYRIAQEALTNVVKHARASQVWINLTSEQGRLLVSIRDDGVGFDVASHTSPSGERGIGLIAMRQRMERIAGTLEVESEPGQGTEVRLSIPLH